MVTISYNTASPAVSLVCLASITLYVFTLNLNKKQNTVFTRFINQIILGGRFNVHIPTWPGMSASYFGFRNPLTLSI